MPEPVDRSPPSVPSPSPGGRAFRVAGGLAAVALGAGAAIAVAACGEDREGSVENIGGATTATEATTAGTVGTSPSTTGATTGTTGNSTSPATTGEITPNEAGGRTETE